MLGIGAIVGAGIFVLTGTAAARHAGPAVVLSFALAGVGVGLRRVSATPSSHRSCPKPGSAYTYGYATLGEFFAWIIGWDLILEYAVGAIAVAGRLVGLPRLLPERLRHHHSPGVLRGPRHAPHRDFPLRWRPPSTSRPAGSLCQPNLLGQITRLWARTPAAHCRRSSPCSTSRPSSSSPLSPPCW